MNQTPPSTLIVTLPCRTVLLLMVVTWGPVPSWSDEVIVIPAREHQGGNAQSVACSPDGRLVAAAFGGASTGRFPLQAKAGGVVVWEAATGNLVQSSGEYGDIVGLQITHDNANWLHTRVYTPGDSVDANIACLMRISDGSLLRRWGSNASYVAAVSPIAPQIAIAEGKGVCGIFAATDRSPQPADARVLSVPDAYRGRCLAYSTDGNTLAVVHAILEPIVRDNGTVARGRAIRRKGLTLFNAADGSLRRTIVSDELLDCTAVDVSRDARWIATGHRKGVVRLWSGESLRRTRVLDLQTETTVLPRFSPDGRRLAVLTQPANSPVWRYANTPSGFEFGRKKVGAACELAIFDTDRFEPQRRFRFQDGVFRTFHANRPEASLNPSRMAFSPEGSRILVGCNGVMLIDAASGEIVRQFQVTQKAQ